MIDLTEILDDVARKAWNDLQGYVETAPYDELALAQRHKLKSDLLPIVAATAEAVERARAEEILARVDRALERVQELRDKAGGFGFETARLDGKLDGMKLIRSYLEEERHR